MFNMNILWVSQKMLSLCYTLGSIDTNILHSNNSSMNHRKGTIFIYTFLCVLNVTDWSCKTRGGTLAVIHLAHDIHVLKSYSTLFKWKPHTVKQCYEIQKVGTIYIWVSLTKHHSCGRCLKCCCYGVSTVLYTCNYNTTICPVRWKHQQEILRQWRLVLMLIRLIRYQN